MRHSSIVVRISAALVGIVALAATTMLTSYWISDRADSDAYAINLAGSLRMQSYKVGLLLAQQPVDHQQLRETLVGLERTWDNPIFDKLRRSNPALEDDFQAARDYWQTLRPTLQDPPASGALAEPLHQLVGHLDALVLSIQHHAERNTQLLRRVQVTALLLILLVSAIAIYWLRAKVAQPLSVLTRAAKNVGQGDFGQRIAVGKMDELGILANTFNQMSDAISTMHQQMGTKIDEQTLALQRSNTALQFLYDTANSIIVNDPKNIDYDRIVNRLSRLVDAEDIELCLITSAGDKPYLQVKPSHGNTDPCAALNCFSCLKGEVVVDTRSPLADGTAGLRRYSFPMMYEQKHYGVLVCRVKVEKHLAQWQKQLVQSVADQLALALSLQAQEDNARRLSLTHERTVIARELHDSLAQALSYLKIQVVRLNRALSKDDKRTLADVSAELHEGLSSAYRQLRELLTTFRLKVDSPELISALQTSVKQLSEQTDMRINLDYGLTNLPLSPNEEIHLLQIVREASQNALHHSQGKNLDIQIYQNRQSVEVCIEDDGVGIAETPEKLNHYGLAIMRERGRNLGGDIRIHRRDGGGTGVYFSFTPEYFKQRELIAKV